MMKCIRGTKDVPLILSTNGSGILKWWIDGSFGVHPNMRGDNEMKVAVAAESIVLEETHEQFMVTQNY
jgi:hypothetical protein